MINQHVFPLFICCCRAAAAARQGKPADGTAVLSNMFAKALRQQGGNAGTSYIRYIRDESSLYFSMLDKKYSYLIGKVRQNLPNKMGISQPLYLCFELLNRV